MVDVRSRNEDAHELISAEMDRCAPIALFVYNRPFHTEKTLRALKACPEFSASPLYVFCDGPKDIADPSQAQKIAQVRQVVRELVPSSAVVVERRTNLGLARSIIQGVSELCERHGRVVVLEDDLQVTPGFLAFLNEGLVRYLEAEKVFQISGYQFPIDPGNRESFFLSFPTSWGWATWKRAWDHFDAEARGFSALSKDSGLRHQFDLHGNYPYFQMLESQMSGKVDSWAIRWHLTCFLAGALTLYPGKSLVQNLGTDGSGTHGDATHAFRTDLASERITRFPSELKIDQDMQARVEKYLGRLTSNSLVSRVRRLGERFFR